MFTILLCKSKQILPRRFFQKVFDPLLILLIYLYDYKNTFELGHNLHLTEDVGRVEGGGLFCSPKAK